MKTVLTITLCILAGYSISAQPQTTAFGNVNFEGTLSTLGYLSVDRDTVSNPNNIWQIGKPQKQVFTSAFSTPNVIVTDTVASYPVNSTSSFVITQAPNFGWWNIKSPGPYMYVRYNVDADSLSDFGKIEIKLNGITAWINILEDITYNFFPAGFSKPVLTGSSNGWKQMGISFYGLADSLNLPSPWNGTISLRFTFISDGIQSNRDGLMFDNFSFVDLWDNVGDIKAQAVPLKIYPNPADKVLTFSIDPKLDYGELTLIIKDVTGKEVSRNRFVKGSPVLLSTSELSQGTYLYQVTYDDKYFSCGTFNKN